MSEWKAGKKLDNDNYVVVKRLGKGGFGITYLARDKRSNLVAIKTLNEYARSDADKEKWKRDFYNEALRLAQCSHPHVVAVRELIHVDDLPCIVMEYIPGQDLATQGLIEEEQALNYINQIGSALIRVHQENLLHRDVKPQNILIHKDSKKAILIDFGIAREYSPDRPITRTAFDSYGYTPIEQYERKGQQEAYTDVHALAGTLYFILTGTVPEKAPTRAKSIAAGEGDCLREPKELNQKISDRVNDAIIQGMAFWPENRPRTIEAWLALLNPPINNSISTTHIPTEEMTEPAPSLGYKSRLPWLWIIIGIAVIFLFLGFVVTKINNNKPVDPDKERVDELLLHQNKAYGFQLKHPANWALREYEPNDFTKEVVELIAGDEERKAKLYVEVRKLKETNICAIDECAAKIKQATEQSLTNAVLLEEGSRLDCRSETRI